MTDEETKLVDEFVGKRKPTYPIVILKGNALETALGVAHFPFNGVIDTEGKLVYAGDSPESTLGKVMKNAKPGSPWPKKLVKASLALRASIPIAGSTRCSLRKLAWPPPTSGPVEQAERRRGSACDCGRSANTRSVHCRNCRK